MKVSYFCFAAAACAGLVGMCLGIVMGITQDFTLSPAHAHLNLLGWVTMALYGLYHRGVVRSRQRLAWTQVGMAAVGFPLMSGGLGVYLGMGMEGAVPFVVAGSLLCVGSMLLFMTILAVDYRQGRSAQGSTPSSLRIEAAAS